MAFYPLHLTLKLQSFVSKKMILAHPQIIDFKIKPKLQGNILDLGGGGEGVIGRLFGSRVTAVDIRQTELDEIPDGPIKLVADARALPLESQTFDTVTSFYFFMYLQNEDIDAVLKEGARVLSPKGEFHIWDTVIPERGIHNEVLYAVPIAVKMPEKSIQTAYGTKWINKTLTLESIIDLALKNGFKVKYQSQNNGCFYLVLNV